jgi:hypothetical protein
MTDHASWVLKIRRRLSPHRRTLAVISLLLMASIFGVSLRTEFWAPVVHPKQAQAIVLLIGVLAYIFLFPSPYEREDWRDRAESAQSRIEQRFSWRTFLKSLLIQIAVLSLIELYWYKSSGEWKSSNLVVVLVFAWINAFGAWRWRQIRLTVKNGTFSEDEDRANIYLGSPGQQYFAIAVGVAIMFVWAIYEIVKKLH